MFSCMKRTTLVLEDGCMDAAREIVHKEGRQFSQVVNDLLVEGVQRRKRRVKEAFNLPAFSMGRPKINLGDRHVLEALMDS